MKPTAYILVGVPGAGKTTWVETQHIVTDFVYVSSDFYVESEANRRNTTYSEVFDSIVDTAISNMLDDVEWATSLKKNVIWDQTSTTRKSRAKKFKYFEGYKVVAVVFKMPDEKELQRRLDSRKGKCIPKEVVSTMISQLEMPTLDEGFDEIIMV